MQLQRQVISQEQRLRMNHQLLQSIKMMELPVVELRERIELEIEKNPALEVLEDHSLVSLDDAIKPRNDEEEYFEVTSDSGFSGGSGEEASDERRRFIEGALSRPETLQEHLLWQLRLESPGAETKRIGELIIQNLDNDGFNIEPPEVFLKNENGGRVEKALALVRSLEPRGCASSGFMESLKIQIELLQDAPNGLVLALDCLDLLEKGKIAEAAKKIGRTEEETAVFLERLRELSPFPGRSFSSEETRFVVPDIQVVKKDGEFSIILNDEEIPVLGLNPFFMKVSSGDDKNGRNFARENIKEARWFIQSINDRNHTLLRITRAVVEFQRGFFMDGPKHIAPLTQRDIARELGINESTVSRTAHGKYVQTEWGIFELRYFFTNSISGTGSSGSKYSKEGVKEIIKEMLSPGGDNFSDQEISGLLSRQGISIARRTVAKYRKELDLGSSYSRPRV